MIVLTRIELKERNNSRRLQATRDWLDEASDFEAKRFVYREEPCLAGSFR